MANNSNNGVTPWDVILMALVVLLVTIVVGAFYMDEHLDGKGERLCMEKLEDIPADGGWSPKCDL